jgi:CheY-like chemotaxis protein
MDNIIENTMSVIGKKVFIVEDDVFLGRVLSSQIRDSKMNAELFNSAEEALEALKMTIPDIILLDIFLPGMNGLDALALIRKDDRTKNIPVLVVSNTDEAKDRERALELGAKFLIKGASTPDEILQHMTDILTEEKV